MRTAFTNTFKTFILLAFLGAVFIGIGAIFGTGGLIIGAALGLLFVGGTYWFSDKIAVAAARAKPVTRDEAPRLYEIVGDLARRDGLPMPRLYVSPEAQPNAFATGRGPKKAVVCVTQGILQVLDDDELRGVLAHELSHVKNRDVLIGSVAAAVALAITFIPDRDVQRDLRRRRQRGRRQRHRPARHGDPRPDRGRSPADGSLPLAGVPGRRVGGAPDRRRGAAGPSAAEDRGGGQADPDEREPGRGHRVHRQPAHGAQGQLRQPLLDAPAHGGAHRPPPQLRPHARLTVPPAPPTAGSAHPRAGRSAFNVRRERSSVRGRPRSRSSSRWRGRCAQSRKFVNWRGMPKSASRSWAMAVWRSSFFLPFTRSCWPWTWWETPLRPRPLMNLPISRALASEMPTFRVAVWRTVPLAASSTLP